MSRWREYLLGDLVAGPIFVVCDGKAPGLHTESAVATWWREDGERAERWQYYSGRAWGTRRHEERFRPGSGTDQTSDARHLCDRCPLDVQIQSKRWSVMLDRMAAAGLSRVTLRDLARAA